MSFPTMFKHKIHITPYTWNLIDRSVVIYHKIDYDRRVVALGKFSMSALRLAFRYIQ